MNTSDEGSPKIIVDSDWKNEAQAEKERLAEAEAKAAEAAGEGAAGPGGLPPADFRTLVGMFASQAVMYLGAMADPNTGAAVVDLDYSKHSIDLLAVIEEKTKGNLTEEESQELSAVLHELRLRWVEVSKLVAEQVAKQGGPGVAGDPGSAPGPIVS